MKRRIKYVHRSRIAGFTMLLLSCSMASGQNSSDQELYLSRRFQNYTRSVPREEIYIHTDREEYITGEDLWFNVYLVDRQSFNLSSHSRIVYLELLNPVNEPIIRQEILLKEGVGPGHMRLPDTLVSGTYTIRAYTSWMQNFFPGNCFMKDISIFSSQPSKSFHMKVWIDENPGRTGGGLFQFGSMLTTIRNENGDVEISFDANGSSCEKDDLVYVFIQSHGKIIHVGSLKMTEGKTGIIVPGTDLSPGISQITLFDYNGNPLCEKYIFYPPGEIHRAVDLNSAETCETREMVSLEFLFDEAPSDPLQSAFSISISPKTDNAVFPDIDDYLVFGTEFGSYPRSVLNGRKIGDLRPAEMDTLLGSLKSNWIDWGKIFLPERPGLKYQAEALETSILGRLIDSNLWPAQRDEILTMSSPGKNAGFQYAVTDDDGNFSFIVPVDEEERDLIIQADNMAAGYKILLRSPFSDQLPLTRMVIDTLASAIPSYIAKWRMNSQISAVYETSFTGDFLKSDTSLYVNKRFYGKPDFELIMDDYVRLPLMEEVFFELIPRVRMKKTGSSFEIIIVDPAGNTMYNVPPILMIDGVIVKNASPIGNMDPDLVEKIDIIWNTYAIDAYLFSGIVNVITRAGDFSSAGLSADVLRLNYRISKPVATFVSPDYSTNEKLRSRIPDMRNTLYWNPSVQPDKNGKYMIEFWSSDIVSDYVIKVEGVTGDGKIVSLTKTFSVK